MIMKKKLLSAFLAPVMVLCLVPTSVQAAEGNIPIDEQHFPDANFRSYLKTASFNDGDDILTTEELANAKEIICDFKDISDLTGIEYFTNLTQLFCPMNNLTSLDVSKNTKLTQLWCSYNFNLTSLDVSKNTNLTYLTCEGNQLTSLDVSKNTNLTYLDCSVNELTSLDITNNPNITTWRPNNNSYAITAIDGVFDLSNLPGNFQVSRASNWNGATEKDGILTITDPSKVTYTYDCDGKGGKVATFTLEVTHHNHSWSDEWTFDDTHHWHNCTAEGCPITDNSEKDGYANHVGGTATCTEKAVCEICGEGYGNLASHELMHISSKAPTAAEVGNKEYCYCNICNKYFSDENATNEIESADTVLAKLTPIIIDGNGATVTEGEKKALSFTSDAAFEDFICVEVDGKTLDESNYTVKSGSIVVTLNADYVSTLSVGEHTLGIVSESGTAKATFTVNNKATATATTTNDNTKSPQTGDTGNMPLLFTLLLAGGGAATATIIARKKKEN